MHPFFMKLLKVVFHPNRRSILGDEKKESSICLLRQILFRKMKLMEYVNKFKLKESWIELGIRKLTKHTGENYYLQGEQNILQEMKNDHS